VKIAGSDVDGVLLGVAAVDETTAVWVGEGQTQGGGAFLFADGTVTRTLTATFPSTILGVVMANATHGVCAGPALVGAPVSYRTADGGRSWTPSAEKAVRAVSGDQIYSLGGETYAYVTEWNGYSCRAAIPPTNRGGAAAATWIFRGDESLCTWIFRGAELRPRRGSSAETSRGGAAAATWLFRGDESLCTWIFHGDESRRRRGCDVHLPRSRGRWTFRGSDSGS